MPWTLEQVLALAPDASSAKSGKDLSAARKWATLGANETCAWGTLQGSGKDPYQTCIDFNGPAFKCTCPSRKFPCKHGLGLFLIVVQSAQALVEKQPPGWAIEWLAKRTEKEEKKSAGESEPANPQDPEAQKRAAVAAEKRAASRESNVTGGLDELGIWLGDLMRNGFAALPGKPASFWETPAARLIDAQAPGLARRVGALSGITARTERWPLELLREASLLHLARESWPRISQLPPPVQADVRALIGFTANQEEALAQPGLRDRWLVIGQCVEENDRLKTQRTWLCGAESKRFALVLSFSAAANQPLDISMPQGTAFDGELGFFPSAWPLRALVKHREKTPVAASAILTHQTIAEANAFAAEALIANPWIERVPFALESVTPLRRAHGWVVRDEAGSSLPLKVSDGTGWRLIALSGGRPLRIAGEWGGEFLRPLSIWTEGRFLRA